MVSYQLLISLLMEPSLNTCVPKNLLTVHRLRTWPQRGLFAMKVKQQASTVNSCRIALGSEAISHWQWLLVKGRSSHNPTMVGRHQELWGNSGRFTAGSIVHDHHDARWILSPVSNSIHKHYLPLSTSHGSLLVGASATF